MRWHICLARVFGMRSLWFVPDHRKSIIHESLGAQPQTDSASTSRSYHLVATYLLATMVVGWIAAKHRHACRNGPEVEGEGGWHGRRVCTTR